jgi:hypothetical protein
MRIMRTKTDNYNAVMSTTDSGKTFVVLQCIFIKSVTKIKIEKLVPARICDYGCYHQHDHHQLVVFNSFVIYLLSL